MQPEAPKVWRDVSWRIHSHPT